MKVGEVCKRSAVAINNKADVIEAAKLMREKHVGFLVVFQEEDEMRKPIGVLTDRDIVLQVIAKEVSARDLKVDDVMTRNPLIASDSDDLSDLLQAMSAAGIRRAPVVDLRGALAGVIAVDDAVDVITGLLCDISGSIKNERRQERRARPA